jgi:cell wall-associated NlpC family hydrolase
MTTGALAARAVAIARRLVGAPYAWGGTSPASGFDCSGLVYFVYSRLGIHLPHSSYAQMDVGRFVRRGNLKPGDLVFFSGASHVGLYLGGGRFIHAPHSGTRVTVASLSDPWYNSAYDGARRVLRDTAPVTRAGTAG